MARSATCPTCRGRVPVPPGTRTNARVSCPGCLESFVPPWLNVRAVEDDADGDEPYDPITAEAYTVRRPVGKKVRAKVTAKSQVEADDENWKPQRGGFGMPLLLGLGVGLGVVIPAAFLLGKWAVAKEVGVAVPLVCVGFVVLGLWFVGAALGLFRDRFGEMWNRIFGPW